ncbi:hypothetical protein I4U23_003723 [Adineta vaga]|nr:hypothetical protein I4U23_003723 [Adineta vaga]
MLQSAMLLAQQYNITVEGQSIGYQIIESDGNVMNTLSSTCRLITNSSIVGIVGPTFSRESHVIAPFAAKLGIPVISHASTDPYLSDRQTYSTFYRTVPPDNAAALAIARLFNKFNWTSCIIIYQNDAFGLGGANAIEETFNKNNLTVTKMVVFDTATATIRGDLRTLLTNSPTRIVILWADASHSSVIIQTALNADVIGSQFTWILSTNIPLNSFPLQWHDKLTGMLTVEPVVGNVGHAPINTSLLEAAFNTWKKYEPESFPGANNIDYYALFLFDAVWTLIQALQRLCSTNTSCLSLIDSSYCFDRHLVNSTSFFDIINTNTFLGVSGPIGFSMNTTDRINGTYYVVKNVQKFSDGLRYIPVLVSSDTGDWKLHEQTSTIIWPGKSVNVPTGYAAITGLPVRIAVINAVPFTKATEIRDTYGNITRKLTGYVPDLIEYLRQRMGFVPNITFLPSNQSYNALIDAVANNIYDMVVGDVTVYADRREKIAFSAAIFDNSLRIIMRNTPIETIDWWSFLKPFPWRLWLIFVGVLLWSTLLVFLFEVKRIRTSKRKPLISYLELVFVYVLGTLTTHGWDLRVKTLPSRLLMIAIFIVSFVLVAQYQANLTSDLTISKTHNLISGIDDLKAGKLSFGRIGIRANTAIEAFYLREISSGSRNFYPLLTKEEAFQKLLDNVIDAALMDTGVAEYYVGSVYCNLTLVGAPTDYSQFGIVTQKNWLYQQMLDVTILSLRESGVLDSLKSKWFQTSYCSHSSDSGTGDLPIESLIVIDFNSNINVSSKDDIYDSCNNTATTVDLDQSVNNVPLVNRFYIGLAMVHIISGFLYWWVWHDRSWLNIIMIPKYLNHLETSSFLWSAICYAKENTF